MDAPRIKAEWENFKGYISMTWEKVSEQELVRLAGDLSAVVALIEEKYRDPKEKIEAKIKELFDLYLERKAQLKEEIGEIRDDLAERSSRILHGIRDKSTEYTDTAKQRIDKLRRENIDPAMDKSEEYIKLHPFTAVLGALGAGVLLGGLIGLLARKD